MWDLLKYSDNIAAKDEFGNSITYGELNNIGNELRSVVKDRCLVAVLAKNTIGSLIGYISFVNNQIVPMMLNAHLEKELRDNLLVNYAPAYIWAPSEMAGEFDNMSAIYSVFDYSLFSTGYKKSFPLYEELALLLTTSGSTGSPKFVRQSYANIKANTDAIIEYLEINENEKPITTLPMNYTYGLSIINTHIMTGATVLLTERSLMQKEFWTFFKENGVTSFGGVPYTYEMLKRLRFMRMDLPTLKTMTQAGGKLSPLLHEEFAKYADENGKRFFVMYGQCEATARMGYLPAKKAGSKTGSMGVAIPGGKFTLKNENGEMIEQPLVVGELIYEGENVTLGYAENGGDLIKGDERNGILQTGDMAMFDEEGYYYIVGRKKRFLKIYGNRVNLDEVDGMIKNRFENTECVCAGVDDSMYIFLTDESKAGEIKDFVVHKTGLNPVAFKTVIIDEIPKNEAGKVLYREFEKYYK